MGRMWWHRHEELTRNHRWQRLEEPVADVYEWFVCRPDFRQQTAFFYEFYQQAA
ncbi:MAG: hypothetical protein RMJ16_12080 [Thermoguttaceae bacterium]|nr:hypothetical protein [Thermoguttaceae bacterium]